MRPINDIQRALRDGETTREDFWRAMQAWHLGLRQYQQLIATGSVEAIEVLKDELRVVTDRGVKLVWSPEDLRTAPNVLVNTGEYEPLESAALAQAAQGAEVVMDIGANLGFFSLNWATALASGGVVHAFEPVPTTYRQLARNIELNGFGERIRANNLGVGDAPGDLTMFVPEFSGSGAASIRNLHPDEASSQVRVPITTVDRYAVEQGFRRLDLVKVDVEGAELMVVRGGLEAIGRFKPLMFLELLRKWSAPFGYHPNDVLDLLRGQGYGCYTHEGGRLVPFERMTDETVQTNFFFAHPDRHGEWLRAQGITC